MNYRVIVSAVIRKDNKVLLGRKAPGRGPFPDTWHIPGGGVDLEKETCDVAVLREVKEETGLTVKNLQKIYWDTGIEPNKHGETTNYVFLVYQCDYESGELLASDDLEKLEWIDVENLHDYPVSIYTKTLFERLNLYA